MKERIVMGAPMARLDEALARAKGEKQDGGPKLLDDPKLRAALDRPSCAFVALLIITLVVLFLWAFVQGLLTIPAGTR